MDKLINSNTGNNDKKKDEEIHSRESFFKIVIKILFLFTLASVVVLGGVFSWSNNFSGSSFMLWFVFALPLIIHIIGWFVINREAYDKRTSKAHYISPEGETSKSTWFNKLLGYIGIRLEENDEKGRLTEPSENQKGILTFCTFYDVTMIFSVLFYCIPWFCYIFDAENKDGWFRVYSFLSLMGIAFQFFIVAVVSYIIIETSQEKILRWNTANLRKGLELCPFWRVAHFLAIFMSISYLFGFAFAFHNLSYYYKNPAQPALYVENLDSDEKYSKNTALTATVSVNTSLTPKPKPPFCFYFDSNKAQILAEDKSKMLADFESIKDEDRIKYMRLDDNYKNFDKLFGQIEAGKSKGIPRLTLVGRADEKKSGDSYPSNYELSEARIQTTKNEITKRLYEKNHTEWQAIDWMQVAYSSEGSINQKECPDCRCADVTRVYKGKVKNKKNAVEDKEIEKIDPDSRKRVVEVYLSMVSPNIQSPQTVKYQQEQAKQSEAAKYKNPPNLTDYMYFSIYTITTTGYGDIKPATIYAKILVSLENFFEVFFLVCFMNTLIALKSERYKG